MALHRDPAKTAGADQRLAHIHQTLEHAVENFASYLLVDEVLDLDPETCERALDQMYPDLDKALTHQQLLRAVLCLIQSRAWTRAETLADEYGLTEAAPRG